MLDLKRAGFITCHDLGCDITQRASAVHIGRTVLRDRIEQASADCGEGHDPDQHDGEQGNDEQRCVIDLSPPVFRPSVHAVSPFYLLSVI